MRICERCRKGFAPRNHTHKYCGNRRYKSGCSYIVALEKSREHSKKNRNKPKKTNRDNYLRNTYGVSEQWYLDTLEKQAYCCYICQKPRNDQTQKYLCVDHCHTTGKVRGLLCTSCNQALGMLKDNIKFLKKAIEYLETNS